MHHHIAISGAYIGYLERELAAELLSSYSSYPDFRYKSICNQVAYYFSQFAAFINDVANSIPTLTSGEIMSFLIKLFLVFVVLMVVNIPFGMARSALYHLFRIFPFGIGSLINAIIGLLFDVVYGVVFIYCIYIFTKRSLVDPAADKRSFEAYKHSQRNARYNNRNNGGNMGFKSASAGNMQGADNMSENYNEDNMNNNFTAEGDRKSVV